MVVGTGVFIPLGRKIFSATGSVKLSVLSRTGKEAVVADLTKGDFFGEGCLAGQPRRIATTSAMSASDRRGSVSVQLTSASPLAA